MLQLDVWCVSINNVITGVPLGGVSFAHSAFSAVSSGVFDSFHARCVSILDCVYSLQPVMVMFVFSVQPLFMASLAM